MTKLTRRDVLATATALGASAILGPSGLSPARAAAPLSGRQAAGFYRYKVGDIEVTFGPSRPGDYRAKRVSSERARTELGWAPRFDFAAGLQRTLDWYRRQ